MKQYICWMLVGAVSLGVGAGCKKKHSHPTSEEAGGAAGAETGGTSSGGTAGNATGGVRTGGVTGGGAETGGVQPTGGVPTGGVEPTAGTPATGGAITGGAGAGGTGGSPTGGMVVGGSAGEPVTTGGTVPLGGTSGAAGMMAGSAGEPLVAGAAGVMMAGAGGEEPIVVGGAAGMAAGAGGEGPGLAGAGGVALNGGAGGEGGGLADAMPLIPAGSTWKYLDDGSDQGTAWYAPGFDDAAWAEGPAELGYDDNPATTVSWGPDEDNKYTTTYFRHSFVVNDPDAITDLEVRVERDDGAVVYLNGTEVWRTNMPATGTITYQTFASGNVNFGAESTFYTQAVDASLLVQGTNVIAVEVHQATLTSSDLSFDLELGLPSS